MDIGRVPLSRLGGLFDRKPAPVSTTARHAVTGLLLRLHGGLPALPPKTKRRVLLLQGPTASFFEHVKAALFDAGTEAWSVCFSALDRFYASRTNRLVFPGRADDFPLWLRALLLQGDFDDLIFSDCYRPLHQVAAAVGKDCGVQVWSLADGYIGPGYVTFEREGNYARSPLAGLLPPETPATAPVSEQSREPAARWLFQATPPGEPDFTYLGGLTGAFLRTRHLCRVRRTSKRERSLIDRLSGSGKGRYFFIPLQRAPCGQLRVHVLNTGSEDNFTRHSAGTITINSTVGVLALRYGVPLLVLGDALYRHPALVSRYENAGDLDRFWGQEQQVATPGLRHVYLNWICRETLVPGDFFTDEGIARACAAIVQKMSS